MSVIAWNLRWGRVAEGKWCGFSGRHSVNTKREHIAYRVEVCTVPGLPVRRYSGPVSRYSGPVSYRTLQDRSSTAILSVSYCTPRDRYHITVLLKLAMFCTDITLQLSPTGCPPTIGMNTTQVSHEPPWTAVLGCGTIPRYRTRYRKYLPVWTAAVSTSNI